MLGSEILKQGQLFLEAAVLGAFLMFVYDCLRVFRRIRKHGAAAVAVEDLLFWICSAFWMFGFMYRQNEGVIRGFFILGAAVGMVLYGALVSRYVVRAGTACVRRVLRILGRFLRAVGAPFRRLGRFLWRKTDRSRIFWKKVLEKQKKQLKKIGKAFRMELRRL